MVVIRHPGSMQVTLPKQWSGMQIILGQRYCYYCSLLNCTGAMNNVPSPSRALVLECSVAMRKATEASLRRRSLLNSKLTVNFRLDVYRYTFKDKQDCNRYDFPEDLFPFNWDVVYKKIRDGCRIQYPVSFKPAIQWSKRVYFKGEDDNILRNQDFQVK